MCLAGRMSISSKSSRLWRDLFVRASNNRNGVFNGHLNTFISPSSFQRGMATTAKKGLKNILNSEASDSGDNASNTSKTIASPYTVYVSNINRKLDLKAFQELFSQYGNVVTAKVIFDQKDGHPRVYGFVTFSSQTEVESAVAALHRKDFDGRSLVVREALND